MKLFSRTLPEKIHKFNQLISEKYKLKVLRFKNKEEIIQYVDPMFDLLDETYKHLSTYTPISDEQRKTYKEKYFKLIDKDFIVCIADENNNLISFAITMPSYSKLYKNPAENYSRLAGGIFYGQGRKTTGQTFI